MHASLLPIAESLKDQLDNSPVFQKLVLGFFILVGLILVFMGYSAIKNKKITDNWGLEYSGRTAVWMGAAVCGLGVMFILVALGFLLFK